MGFITKVDFTRQVKQGPGEIATLSGSTTILGNLDVYGMIMSGGTDISTLWGGASSGTNKFVTGGSLDGSYDLTLDYNDGGSATPISLSALSDNVVVRYVLDLDDLNEAFAFFTGTSTGGIVKMGATISLSSDLELDFDQGIELWGGGFGFTMNGNIITVKGSRATFRNVAFTGDANFDTGTGPNYYDVNSENIIKIDDNSMSTLKFIECRMNDVVGGSGGTLSADTYYPIIIENCSNWSVFEFIHHAIGTRHDGGDEKPYGPFAIKWNESGTDGTRLIFTDWYNNSPEQEAEASRFIHYKNSMVIKIDGGYTEYQNQIVYDGSVTIDPTSTFGSGSKPLDLYSTSWGPVVTQYDHDPTATATFGYAGDIQITGNSAYMKVGTTIEGGDTDWIQLGVGGGTDTNSFVTGGTYNGGTEEIDYVGNGGFTPFSVDVASLVFSGNTSGTCITDLYVTNVYGCSPLNITASNLNIGAGTNILIGEDAGVAQTTSQSTIVGVEAASTVLAINAGVDLTLVGYRAGQSIGGAVNSSDRAVYIGGFAGAGNIAGGSGDDNVAIGYKSFENVSRGIQNVMIGNLAGQKNTDGASNVVVGYSAGLNLTPSTAAESKQNVIIGAEAGSGASALAPNKGADNVTIGYKAAATINDGTQNVFIGTETGGASQALGFDGSRNIGIGYQTMTDMNHTTGTDNIAIGYSCMVNFQRGVGNIVIGDNAGPTFVGASSQNNILIGSAVDIISDGDDNKFILGTGTSNKYLLSGDFGTTSECKLGINMSNETPSATLEIHSGGNTSATDALLIGDSLNATTLLQLKDDGSLTINESFTLPITAPTVNGMTMVGQTSGLMAWGFQQAHLQVQSLSGSAVVGTSSLNLITASGVTISLEQPSATIHGTQIIVKTMIDVRVDIDSAISGTIDGHASGVFIDGDMDYGIFICDDTDWYIIGGAVETP